MAYQGMEAMGEEPDCGSWEARLADLVEGTLSPEEEAALREHAAGCVHCQPLLEDVAAGRQWVRVLHSQELPVPPALLDRILARTSQAGPPSLGVEEPVEETWRSGVVSLPGAAVLPLAPVLVLQGQRRARVLMTAAMAVFSLALTLSLTLSMTGEHVGSLHPGNVAASASRQFFDAKKQVVFFYDNLRLVREWEAAVETMRRSADDGQSRKPRGRSGPSALRREPVQPATPMLVRQDRTPVQPRGLAAGRAGAQTGGERTRS